MCRFEASRLADLRAGFGVFMDTKYRELPGASCASIRAKSRGGTPGWSMAANEHGFTFRGNTTASLMTSICESNPQKSTLGMVDVHHISYVMNL